MKTGKNASLPKKEKAWVSHVRHTTGPSCSIPKPSESSETTVKRSQLWLRSDGHESDAASSESSNADAEVAGSTLEVRGGSLGSGGRGGAVGAGSLSSAGAVGAAAGGRGVVGVADAGGESRGLLVGLAVVGEGLLAKLVGEGVDLCGNRVSERFLTRNEKRG